MAADRLSDAACRPRVRVERERRLRQELPAALLQRAAGVVVEPAHVCPRGTHTLCVRLPPVLEARVLDARSKLRVLDSAQPSRSEQLGQVAFAHTGEVGLAASLWTELTYGPPEGCQRGSVAGVIQNTAPNTAP